MYAFKLPPIVYAASFGLSTIVQFLLADYADANVRSTSDEIALMVASGEGFAFIVDVLSSSGANADLLVHYGRKKTHNSKHEHVPEGITT